MNQLDENPNYIEEELKKASIFINENKLSANYVPKNLLFRDDQFKKLSNLFKSIIEDPGGASRQVIIHGPVGTGKTAVIKRFISMLQNAAYKRDINLKYVHINCRINKTTFLILKAIIKTFNNKIPERGLSSEELIVTLNDILEKSDFFLIVILDEIDSLKKSQFDVLYYLSRIMDTKLNPLHRLSLILVAKSLKFLENLDTGTLSTLQNYQIYFQKYSKQELIEIIKYRIREVFYDDVVPNETILKISELANELGDIRIALELLWKAGKETDSLNSFKIMPDLIEKNEIDSKPFIKSELFDKKSRK